MKENFIEQSNVQIKMASVIFIEKKLKNNISQLF